MLTNSRRAASGVRIESGRQVIFRHADNLNVSSPTLNIITVYIAIFAS
jgi:hypothetical protein